MDFAIVGMDCLLPGSPDASCWIKATEPAIREVSPDRWPDVDLLADALGTPDRTVSLRGAWVDEPGGATAWSQRVIGNVLDEAKVKPESTHLFLANLSLPSTEAVRALLEQPGDGFLDGRAETHASSAPATSAADFFRLGQVTCLDAACASGLYAVRLAMDALRSGDCDAAIAAGVQACDPSYLLVGFSQLLALSAEGTPKPLDAGANGLVVGEGAAAVLLKRLPDALAAGDRIHGVLRDGGLGNDGRKGNMLAPDTRGQLRAMRAAWEAADLDPRTLGYVECHATGTTLGDATEVRSLRALLEEAGPVEHPVAIGSAKAMIGHTITVAGLAGLIRATGAVRDGFVPQGPTTPIDVLRESTHLRAAPAREPWPEGVPRRAAVSAFGFGGTNAHLIVDGPPPAAPKKKVASPPAPEPQGRFGIRAGLRRLLDRDRQPDLPPEPVQLAAAPAPAELVETPRLAITGLAGRIGSLEQGALFDALHNGQSLVDARGRAAVRSVDIDPRRWRIPPLELCDLLPQQLLAMEIGGDALLTAGVERRSVAVVMGLELDSMASTQVLRWTRPGTVDVPALDAQRVQGQLPNFVANRLSAQLGLEGPSFTVSAGAASGAIALQQAARLLGSGAVDAVVVGAVDLEASAQGAIAFVVERLSEDVTPLAIVDVSSGNQKPTASSIDAGCLTSLVDLLAAIVGPDERQLTVSVGKSALTFAVQPTGAAVQPLPVRERVLEVSNGRGDVEDWFGPGAASWLVTGDVSTDEVPLPWSRWSQAPVAAKPSQALSPLQQRSTPRAASTPRSASKPPASVAPRVTPPPSAPVPPRTAPSTPFPVTSVAAGAGVPPTSVSLTLPAGPDLSMMGEIEGIDELAASLARSSAAVAGAHAQFLANRRVMADQIASLGASLALLDPGASPGLPAVEGGSFEALVPAAVSAFETPVRAPHVAEPLAHVPPTGAPPRSYDRAALIRHASGKLSEVFGPTFADQDAYEPRTRMPEPPLLLCSRVVTVDGDPGTLGPSRIVTEYDLPVDESWSHHDGKPNACVIVESGQADLFLVSYLGVERHCKGNRVYRLLDCDLTFHGERPHVGETLHHDIRIKSFAKLGSKILFYFEYDCTSNTDGRSVLTMRNGVAGFFTPGELSVPQGVDNTPPPLEHAPERVQPRLSTSVTSLDEHGVQALVEGRFSDAFGPGFAAADGSRLTLPNSEWRLVHRVQEVRTNGGPYGLGLARTEQILRDDDWFNPCHFKGDPCMPGTLMLEGCLQVVQTWLLAAGVAVDHPDGLFEPLPDLAFELRCRGQVVPGHSSLVYEARIKEACLDGVAFAIADVVLSVDGTPVVIAKNVGVTIGRRLDVREAMPPLLCTGAAGVTRTRPAPLPAPAEAAPVVDVRRIYEYSIGDAERAFGSHYGDYAGIEPRCARMPGPPLLQMTRVLEANNAFEVKQGESVTIAYDVPPEAWYWNFSEGHSMPFAILLETALQPCGWLTAWQAAGIKDGRNLYFRNLGGKATQHMEVWPDTGTLLTTTKQTVVAQSAGLLIHNFDLEVVTAHGEPVYSCTTSFGYFTNGALDGQKGLPVRDEERRLAARANGSGRTVDLRDHPSMPRADWRNLDEVIVVDEQGGKAGLGFYEAVKHIDPDEWFFTAHFFLDPVMPGSLGLEAALQLARFVLEDRTGRKRRVTPIRLGIPHEWKYRGQMRRPVKRMTLELDVTSISDDEIVFDAVLRGDGTAIYELIGFGITAVEPRLPAAPPVLAPGPSVAALLDSFAVSGTSGTGHVTLDPERFPWLADHCPTATAPAMPMAFAAEIAAEAALQLRPGAVVVGVPMLEAESWIHTGNGPIDVLVVAVAEGDTVAVSLAVHVENKRFPKLSGPKVHMRAVVQLGSSYPAAPNVEPVNAPRVPMSIQDYYAGGLTFHGPSLQGMVDLGVRSATSAESTFQTRPDAELNGPGHGFVLDPLLLDTATHPMISGEPETWSGSIAPGQLAYPVKAENMVFYGPRPQGDVRCRLDLVNADAHTLTFDVALVGAQGVWATFRWTEALVPGGPVLGRPTPERYAFVWQEQAIETVRIGRSVGERWRVERSDLVEPIEGTLAGLYCTANELKQRDEADDPMAWTLSRLAAKEAARAWLQRRLNDVHPKSIEMLDMREDRTIVVNCRELSAQHWIDHLGPTRFHLCVDVQGGAAEAWFEPTGWPT